MGCDVDVTVYTPWSLDKAQGSLAVWIPYQKELVLDDWWRIIFDTTEPDSWEDSIQIQIHRTTNSLNFNYKGIMIDLLVAFCFFQDSSEQRNYILQLLRVTDRLCQTARRPTVIKFAQEVPIRIDSRWGEVDEEEVEAGDGHCEVSQVLVTDGSLCWHWLREILLHGVTCL